MKKYIAPIIVVFVSISFLFSCKEEPDVYSENNESPLFPFDTAYFFVNAYQYSESDSLLSYDIEFTDVNNNIITISVYPPLPDTSGEITTGYYIFSDVEAEEFTFFNDYSGYLPANQFEYENFTSGSIDIVNEGEGYYSLFVDLSLENGETLTFSYEGEIYIYDDE